LQPVPILRANILLISSGVKVSSDQTVGDVSRLEIQR
jgi:hypothetical protein